METSKLGLSQHDSRLWTHTKQTNLEQKGKQVEAQARGYEVQHRQERSAQASLRAQIKEGKTVWKRK